MAAYKELPVSIFPTICEVGWADCVRIAQITELRRVDLNLHFPGATPTLNNYTKLLKDNSISNIYT